MSVILLSNVNCKSWGKEIKILESSMLMYREVKIDVI